MIYSAHGRFAQSSAARVGPDPLPIAPGPGEPAKFLGPGRGGIFEERMARPTLFTHRKLRKLALILGNKAIAIGSLELIWNCAYQDGDARLGGAQEVEAAAEWSGKPGVLCSALLEAGFLDNGADGYTVHDLDDHAPEYVRKRRKREMERQRPDNVRTTADTDEPVAGQWLDGDAPLTSTPAPAPAPAPTPAPTLKKGASEIQDTVVAPSATKPRRTYPDGFLRAWKAYPHHGTRSSKAKAADLWRRHLLEPATDRVLLWISAAKLEDDWKREGGQFVPAMHVWLARHDFDEDPVEPPPPPYLSEAGQQNVQMFKRFIAKGES